MDLRWIVFLLLNHHVASQSDDPCTSYKPLNDTSFRTDSNIAVDPLSCVSILFPPPPWPQWYRFTATPRGEITTQCPQNSSCGALDQIWIKDPLPSISDGEKSVRTCLKMSTACCANGGNITVKSCNGFFVYKLGLAPRCSSYCINTTSLSLISTTTRATSTLQTSVSDSVTEITTSELTDVSTTEALSTFPSSTLTPQIISTTKIATTEVLISVSNSKVTTEVITSQPTDETTTAPNIHNSHESGSRTSTAVQISVSNSNSTPVISNSERTDATTTSDGLETRNMIAATVGSVVGLAVIALVIFLLYRKKCKNKKRSKIKSTYILPDDIQVAKEGFVEKRKFDVKSIGQQADAHDLAQYNSNEDFHLNSA